ncbi:hypothetical protein [Thalassospira povalilytica]|uniref:Uncharacterized protein n=1 Tax=Thalassospira povalilytica TaxID=732237 RepID=A0A8I1MBZ5_9PROT|nr:hypothetical protein [Thalassospira povalilytica]MBN8198600.1 hypothetical protein [Thalassospira povalilytica]
MIKQLEGITELWYYEPHRPEPMPHAIFTTDEGQATSFSSKEQAEMALKELETPFPDRPMFVTKKRT